MPNPFHAMQVGRIPLDPDRVDALVFWTRDARLLLPHLDKLNERRIRS